MYTDKQWKKYEELRKKYEARFGRAFINTMFFDWLKREYWFEHVMRRTI